jgi:phage terminase small subunit
MNEKQKRFCIEYVKDLNATQAYIRAGYSSSGAGQSGEKLLRNAEISNEVKALQQEMREKNKVSVDTIVTELMADREKAREQGSYSVAVKATMEIARLHGLYEKDNVQKTNSIEGLSKEQLISKLDRLLKRSSPSHIGLRN